MSDNLTEEDYVYLLKQQRHMYTWCLRNIGSLTAHEAKLESEKLYNYEPPDKEYRGIVFHDDAWHWAMLKIKGEQYWSNFPDLVDPTNEYEKEWTNYEKQHS